jgi:hypothetical protein
LDFSASSWRHKCHPTTRLNSRYSSSAVSTDLPVPPPPLREEREEGG